MLWPPLYFFREISRFLESNLDDDHDGAEAKCWNFGFPRPPNCLSRNGMLSLQLSKTNLFLHRKNIQTEVEEAGQQRSNLPNCEAVLQRQQQQPTENDMSSYMMRNLGIILHYQILQFHQTNLRFPPSLFCTVHLL